MSYFPFALLFFIVTVLVAECFAISPISNFTSPEQVLQPSVSSKTLKLLKKLAQSGSFNCTALEAELHALQTTSQGKFE